MTNLLRVLAAASVLCAASSCAGYKVVRVAGSDAQDTKGIRYWRPAPFLLVSEGGKTPEDAKAIASLKADGLLTYQIIYLPDPTENYAIKYHGGLGTADLTFKLVNGWNLTEVNTKTDSKIPETITAVSGLLTAVAGVIAKKAATERVNDNGEAPLTPGLYRILLEGDAITLRRSVLTVASEPAAKKN
ncbi:MAG: hypothetical protein EOO37_04675 [Cytophagaceae bacterium]|nr:MAG: hypothetical protein EOO37_04675 [Cytophagaceae bacterium]